MPKVLIADKMDKCAAEIFQDNGIEIDIKPGLSPEELAQIASQYDGIAARSSAKITAAVISASLPRLKVIGRAGIGVDTIDVPAATEAGIVVMNTPFGNSITTAEHAIAMMFALARQIPQANESTHAGKWEKAKFMGVELYGKTLGIIGCGNIGSIVASRALGLQMKVVAFDPFLSPEKARELGVEKVEAVEDLYPRADFITLHTPLTESTRGMIGAAAFVKMKKGVRIINCARGGLIVEADLKAALDSGQVAGAALDVFEEEPATSNILFGHPNVVCTPHLGASTSEAQVNVAIQVAEQMSDFLLSGAVSNAVNMPSITAEEAPRLKPYMALTEQLGSFAGQITESAVKKVEVEYQGDVAALNVRPLTAMVLASLLRPVTDGVNMVNAPQIAKARGITVSETKTEQCADLHTAIIVTVTTDAGPRSIKGTLFAGREPRIVDIEGVPVEAAVARNMLFIRNDDTPGLIGAVGTLLGDARVNIADFRLGRIPGKAVAVALISIDGDVPEDVFVKIAALKQVQQARRLRF
ncbi:MAG: phosphoglycerate dehydrogenase [Micavibrio aeruginosavorus]|nr:phosphoglycerate dehydrogenase [Micavibrio aeruginosavorus]